jgi:DNA-binding PadR family transcriptional regulator
MEASVRPDSVPPLPRTAMLVLLAIGPEERHGYAIMLEIARITDGASRPGPGGIYTTIRRLLDDGLIEESDVRPDPDLDDQRRRYYRLTSLGRAVAGAEVRRMETIVSAARPWALEARRRGWDDTLVAVSSGGLAATRRPAAS